MSESSSRNAAERIRADVAEMPVTRWDDELDRPVPVRLWEWRAAALKLIDRHIAQARRPTETPCTCDPMPGGVKPHEDDCPRRPTETPRP